MSTFKNCKVVMLPTKGKGPIVLGENLLVNLPGVFRGTNFHLYIISDDKIKKDDWIYSKEPVFGSGNIGNVICQYDNRINYSTDFGDKIELKKIIATTDTSLIEESRLMRECYPSTIGQPSQSFIEKYIESYNKGNVITDVMVEYDVDMIMEFSSGDTPSETLHINPDNTINIKQMKDCYTREEVMEIAAKAHSHGYSLCLGSSDNILEFEDWIKENL